VAAHLEGKLAVEAEIRAGLGLPPVPAMEGRDGASSRKCRWQYW
jgi:hypothetical protein